MPGLKCTLNAAAAVAETCLNVQAEPPSAPASLPSLESSPADEDEEMMDAEEGDDGNAQAGGGEEISPAMAEAAAAVGIDLAFLQALPAELRGEVRITILSHLYAQEQPNSNRSYSFLVRVP